MNTRSTHIVCQRLSIALFVIFAGFCAQNAQAQDPHFTQFYANPLYLNPAFAGSTGCPRVVLNYRNQWPSITGSFVTYAASYDQYVNDLSGGIGLQFLTDDAGGGTLQTTTASGMYSYNINVNRNFAIRAAAQVTFLQKSLDWDKLTFADQIEPRFGFIFNTAEQPRQRSSTNLDFSAGLLGFSKNLFFGAAVHPLN